MRIKVKFVGFTAAAVLMGLILPGGKTDFSLPAVSVSAVSADSRPTQSASGLDSASAGTSFQTLQIAAQSGGKVDVQEAAQPSDKVKFFGPESLIKSDGTYWTWGNDHPVPAPVPGIEHAAASFMDRFVVTEEGKVWAVQKSSFPSQISTEEVQGLTGLTAAVQGDSRVLVVDGQGQAFVGETNSETGRLELPFKKLNLDEVSTVQFYYDIVSTPHYEYKPRWMVLKKDGTVWTNADSALTSFLQIPNLKEVTGIVGKRALTKDGTVWTLSGGITPEQQRGGVSTAVRMSGLPAISALQGTEDVVLAIDRESRLWFWGNTVTGFSDGTTYHAQTKPLLMSGVSHVQKAASVERSIIVLTDSGTVYETSLEHEQLTGNAPFRPLASGVTDLKDGSRHVLMQKQDGSLWGWGINKNGQLGSGDMEFMHDEPVAVQKPVSIHLNGKAVSLNNGAVIRSGQTFVPVRSVFEQLGAQIGFNPETKVVTIKRSDRAGKQTVILLDMSMGTVKLNGASVQLSQEPFDVNGVSYLPLRFISEQLGAKVTWNPDAEDIAITFAE